MKKRLISLSIVVGCCYLLSQMIKTICRDWLSCWSFHRKEILDDVAKDRHPKTSYRAYTHMKYPYSKLTREKNSCISVEPRFESLKLPFKTREEAVELLEIIEDFIRDYGEIRVEDLKILVDEPYNNYGWTTSDGMHIPLKTTDSYYVVIPPAKKLKQ